MSMERCTRPDCSRPATATISYRYDERSVWLGPLDATGSRLHLCGAHAERFSVPLGWELTDLRAAVLPFSPLDEAVA